MRLLSAKLGISFDLYAGTGGESHRQCTQDIFQRLYQQRYIFKDSIDSPYCAHDQRFLPDRWVTGSLPLLRRRGRRRRAVHPLRTNSGSNPAPGVHLPSLREQVG